VEGLDIDNLICGMMRQWYLNILDNSPAHLCPVTNVARQATVANRGLFGLITLPKGTRRVLSVKMSTWLRQKEVRPYSEETRRIERMASPFGRPGCNDPIALAVAEGVLISPVQQDSAIDMLMAIADPGEELYILDEALLSDIPHCLPHAVMPGCDGGSCL